MRRAGRLSFYPPPGLDVAGARFEGVRLRHLIELRGTAERPVRHVAFLGIAFRGIAFRHAARTFRENREPLLRSDWTIYRDGAMLFSGCEDRLRGLRDRRLHVRSRRRQRRLRERLRLAAASLRGGSYGFRP